MASPFSRPFPSMTGEHLHSPHHGWPPTSTSTPSVSNVNSECCWGGRSGLNPSTYRGD
uniref:Uncharacterized protein n=1 Tax=Arundo donax TaxID=35708 RepID=A0A0A9B1F8_ARUDO